MLSSSHKYQRIIQNPAPVCRCVRLQAGQQAGENAGLGPDSAVRSKDSMRRPAFDYGNDLPDGSSRPRPSWVKQSAERY